MLGEDQTQIGLSRQTHARGIGPDHHAFRHFRIACRLITLRAFDLHDTHPAGCDFIDILQIAEMRDRDIVLFSGFQNGRAFGSPQLFSVNCKAYHFSTRPPLKLPNPK